MDAPERHSRAMKLADLAFIARLEGNAPVANDLFRQAFHEEQSAAEQLIPNRDLEPTRSVLCRSAASLALELGKLREAERLISAALSGEPPDEIAEELRDLLDKVNFHRHLATRGIALAEDELQFSMSGPAVGPGIAVLDDFVHRIQAVEKMILRTVERLSGTPFRERGPVRRAFRENLELYMSAPRTGSMTVTMRLGAPSNQMVFPGFTSAKNVIGEVVMSLQELTESKEETLRKRFKESAYYTNFLGLAKVIAPDGLHIKQVGFTTGGVGGARSVALTKPPVLAVALPQTGTAPDQTVTVEGRLRFADALGQRDTIKLIAEEGTQHKIVVPGGMMDDIVRPLWGFAVIVTGVKNLRGTITLNDITRLPEDS